MTRVAVVMLMFMAAATVRAADGPEALLSQGIALVQQGDFEAAVLKLDEATRVLAGDKGRSRALADAYLFLGISYVQLNEELNARAKFREVLKREPQRQLSERVYSRQVIRVFEAARQELYPKKKKRILPLLLIAGGGTATAGAVVAATASGESPTTTTLESGTTTTTQPGGGGNTTTTTTTLVTDPGGPTPTPTTATTVPGPTPTPTGTPTATPTGPTATPTATPTPTATAPVPTATPTATPAATPTPTTMGCTYTMSPPSVNILLLGGNGQCTVTTNLPSCPWTAQASDAWIQFNGQTSGPGNGVVPWSAGLTVLARTGEITLGGTQGSTSARCQIVQGGVVPPPESATTRGWFATSRLHVPGARGQVTVNGETAHFQATGETSILSAANAGYNRVVAQIVTAAGRPGTWRFDVGVPLVPGSLRAEAGEGWTVAERSLEFRLAGRPGERVVFSFLARP